MLLNERGEVAECTAANIFCAKQRLRRNSASELRPPLRASPAASSLKSAPVCRRFPSKKRVLKPEDLYAADEVFITSTN